MNPYAVDQLVDEDALLAVVGGVPDGVGVEVAERLGDAIELVSEVVSSFHVFQILRGHGLDRLDLPSQFALLLGEQGWGDLVGVVQGEELLSVSTELGDGPGARRLRRSRLRCPSVQLVPNRGLQLFILGEDPERKHGSTEQTGRGTARNMAAVPTMLAAVDRIVAPVGVDRHSAATLAAHDTTREQILADSLAGRVPPLGGLEQVRSDQRGLDARVPLIA